MRKLLILLIILLTAASVFLLSSCRQSRYIIRYEIQKCDEEYNSPDERTHFDKRYDGERFIAYFSDSCSPRAVDETVDVIASCAENLRACLDDKSLTLYVGGELVCSAVGDQTNAVVTLDIGERDQTIFAWILAGVYGGNLPFGVYAGIVANEKPINRRYLDRDRISDLGCLAQLQFPLYENNNMSDAEQEKAWNFSYTLVRDLMTEGKNYAEIASMQTEALSVFMLSHYGISLPDYAFYPYSKASEYKVEQGVFTYFIDKQFVDNVFPQTAFRASRYAILADWLEDNRKATQLADDFFGITGMYDIQVIVKGNVNSLICGEAIGDCIRLYSVFAFSHEYMHHVLLKKNMSYALNEVLPDMLVDNVKWANLGSFYLYTVSSPVFSYGEEERQTLLKALDLYNKTAPAKAAPGAFDVKIFADCYAAENTRVGEKWIHRLQPYSFVNFIEKTYGFESVLEYNKNTAVKFNGKTVAEVLEDWLNYLSRREFFITTA